MNRNINRNPYNKNNTNQYNRNNYTNQDNKSEGIYLPDEVFESVPRKYHALLYKGRDQMEIETNNIFTVTNVGLQLVECVE